MQVKKKNKNKTGGESPHPPAKWEYVKNLSKTQLTYETENERVCFRRNADRL